MTAPVISMPRAFATSDAAAGEQIELWERHNADVLVALSCTPPRNGGFDAVEVNLQLPRLHLARVRGTTHRVDRSAELVESSPADAIAVYLPLRGDGVLDVDGRRGVLRPGQVLVCDADKPFARGFGHGLDEFAVKVPRAAFMELTGLPELTRPVVVDIERSGHGRALARLVGRALRREEPVPVDEQTVLDLVGVLATGGRAGQPGAHRAAARAFVDEHFADPDLTAGDVAAGVGISERQLSRLFAAAGTSVPRHILARRLDAAYHLLVTGGGGLRTADVARRCGFVSPGYFAHSFRSRFGVRAGDVRRGAGEVRISAM